MTKRNRTSEPLSAYLDGAMSPADAAAMEKLLAAEPELARELSTLRATRDLVGRLPREHAPDDFARRVVARLERRSLLEPGLHEKPSLSRRRLWVAAAAAAVFLVAGVGTYVALLTFPSPVTVADKSAPHRAVEGPIPLAKVKDAPAPRKDFETGKVSVVTRGSVERETVELAKAPGGPARAKASLRSEIRTETGGPETIYVPVNAGDLTLARRGLERTLFDLEVAPTTEESPASGSATGRAANLVYRTVEASPTQIKYVVANVSRSQLPGVVKRLEEFRQRQDQKQDELASVQTTLALAE
ncbi:MAG: hypothetical protein NT031_07950, partial [Planctomycetota bacterium]|nr:hypothetical protein [Planctomycetota bacterium]